MDFFTRITSTATTGEPFFLSQHRRPAECCHIGPPHVGVYPKKVSSLGQSDKYSCFKHTGFASFLFLPHNNSRVPEGVYLANDFNRALTICECLHSNNKVDEVFVIGGTRLYEAALNQSEYPVRFYCTHVLKDYECDVFFPDIDWKSFKEIT
ncbi:unnamed protein product [Schistocephalus solidus]|uniref:dihydrofolate reductase n=1 Tax=Schistocephalus solidus TaxID=70667 RepID=A0A183T8V5_SCHSO|nr:unnamed protein product [Schistocephalus solidus]